jgi:hypothetical protein
METEILKVVRSRFLESCEQAIISGLEKLEAGLPASVKLERGGYPGQIQVTIHDPKAGSFKTDWQGSDPTRFPARIRAAATALMNCGLTGCFLISHDDGVLTIVRR